MPAYYLLIKCKINVDIPRPLRLKRDTQSPHFLTVKCVYCRTERAVTVYEEALDWVTDSSMQNTLDLATFQKIKMNPRPSPWKRAKVLQWNMAVRCAGCRNMGHLRLISGHGAALCGSMVPVAHLLGGMHVFCHGLHPATYDLGGYWDMEGDQSLEFDMAAPGPHALCSDPGILVEDPAVEFVQ